MPDGSIARTPPSVRSRLAFGQRQRRIDQLGMNQVRGHFEAVDNPRPAAIEVVVPVDGIDATLVDRR